MIDFKDGYFCIGRWALIFCVVNDFADDQVIICSQSNSWPLDIRHQQTICHDFKLQYDPSDLQQEEVEFIVKLVITILNDLVIAIKKEIFNLKCVYIIKYTTSSHGAVVFFSAGRSFFRNTANSVRGSCH